MILQSRWARWCLLTVLVCGSGSMLQAEGTQGWLNNSFKLELSPKWDLKITQELQSREVDYDHTFLKNWSLGVFRALPGSCYAGGSFKREDEDTSSGERIEYRYTIEGVNNHWDLVLNYLRQDTDDAGVIHAVNTGVEVNF